MDYAQMDHGGPGMKRMEHTMRALLGPFDAGQEASGTSWQPASSGHEGIHGMDGSWMLMLHGYATAIFDHQGGRRGNDEFFGASMLMGQAARSLGPGRLGLRTMLSLDPATIPKNGYPLLLESGETADGLTSLVDRQHPHDSFMELAATYSVSSGEGSFYLYGGLPGEPALGPPVFMHRRSGAEIPEAPIGHHWLDSTHITYGVVTLGGTWREWKLEGSAFRGREPDQDRWGIEEPKLDSYAARLSFNPTPDWAFQASTGTIESPEEIHPDVNTIRYTASAIHNRATPAGNWQTTLAWGRNRNRPGRTLDALLLESTLSIHSRHTFMGRAEVADKDELLDESDSLAYRSYRVEKLGLGYLVDPILTEHIAIGVGVYGTVSIVPDELVAYYDRAPLSGMLYLRAKIR
jgi:hypothetical protein